MELLKQEMPFFRKPTGLLLPTGPHLFMNSFPRKKLVANCHKIPQKVFEKRLLSHQELTTSIYQTILDLKDICKEGVQILFTVSPVRHTKDGMVENQLVSPN